MSTTATPSIEQLRQARAGLLQRLLAEAGPAGFWTGRLSSSALATAVAVVALAKVDAEAHCSEIVDGLRWLCHDRNPDGGWGDSPESSSNLSTTLLAWSALGMAAGTEFETEVELETEVGRSIDGAERYLQEQIGGALTPEAIAAAVLSFYGDDRTFSAPILALLAVAGRLGTSSTRWDLVPQLPLELAALPHRLFRWLRLPVVSYALPALIAIGLVRHRHLPSRFAPVRLLRDRLGGRLLRLLHEIQPVNGGFLEAVPLTAFVVMSLAAGGLSSDPVVTAGVAFLRTARRRDGSWPIDSNLATWLTTLAVSACAAGDGGVGVLPSARRRQIREWLLGQQLKAEHPFTHAAPGGWAWTDLPGGVPDADDTSGALLALHRIEDDSISPPARDAVVRDAVARGVAWLLDLQNRDGGIPTFCRGWGRLPFDRSCPDITAHALRALAAWRPALDERLQVRIDRAMARGISYLGAAQRPDGAWLPLWFGNQWAADRGSPVYGTAQVLTALQEPAFRSRSDVQPSLERGRRWLCAAQNQDGGWGVSAGGGSCLEETALALTALAGLADEEILQRGACWMLDNGGIGDQLQPAPIGLYFASLWYSERLYPLIFSVAALGRLTSALAGQVTAGSRAA